MTCAVLFLSTSGIAQTTVSSSFTTFTDITRQAGLNAPSVYGGLDKKRFIIETNGCGVAFLDYDNDGWQDILMLNGSRLEGFPVG